MSWNIYEKFIWLNLPYSIDRQHSKLKTAVQKPVAKIPAKSGKFLIESSPISRLTWRLNGKVRKPNINDVTRQIIIFPWIVDLRILLQAKNKAKLIKIIMVIATAEKKSACQMINWKTENFSLVKWNFRWKLSSRSQIIIFHETLPFSSDSWKHESSWLNSFSSTLSKPYWKLNIRTL